MNHGISFDNLQNELGPFLEELKDKLRTITTQTFTGQADEGRILATVNSTGIDTDISINVLAKRRHDNLTLSDLILEAINDGRREAAAAKKKVMSESKIFGISLQSFIDNPADMRNRINLRANTE